MRKFLIVVDGHKYTGLFLSSMDAAIDALEKNPDASRISVKPDLSGLPRPSSVKVHFCA